MFLIDYWNEGTIQILNSIISICPKSNNRVSKFIKFRKKRYKFSLLWEHETNSRVLQNDDPNSPSFNSRHYDCRPVLNLTIMFQNLPNSEKKKKEKCHNRFSPFWEHETNAREKTKCKASKDNHFQSISKSNNRVLKFTKFRENVTNSI